MIKNNIKTYCETNAPKSPPVISFPYVSPTPGKLPIICWEAFNIKEEEAQKATGNDYAYKAYLKKEILDITECGFNVANRMLYANVYKDIKPLLSSNHLPIIANIPKDRLTAPTICMSFVNEATDGVEQNTIGAWLLGDEPKYNQLGVWRECYSEIKSLFPSQMVYINLNAFLTNGENYFDDYGNPTDNSNTGPYQTYPEYLEHIRRQFRLAVWSYDLYPFRETPEGKITVDSKFYLYLEYFSTIASQTGRPFWAFCQCIKVSFTNGAHALASPTVSRMRFEAFSALAYGAQGIQYWRFLHAKPSGNEIYSESAIDSNGNRTKTWDAIKTVNQEISKFEPVFLNAELIMCRHTGNRVWTGTTAFNEPIGPLQKVESGSSGVLISHLINNGKNYLVIVNHDAETKQGVTLTFNSQVNEVFGRSLFSSEEMNYERATSQKVFKILDAGGYVIYTW